MAFELPTLAAGVAIVDKKGNPTPQFMLFWQRVSRQIQDQEEAQDTLTQQLQQQQTLILQLLLTVTQNVVYLNNLSEYLIELSNASNARLVFTQCAVATVAGATMTDISGCGDPLDFPTWPGEPPTPPWDPDEDPGP